MERAGVRGRVGPLLLFDWEARGRRERVRRSGRSRRFRARSLQLLRLEFATMNRIVRLISYLLIAAAVAWAVVHFEAHNYFLAG